MPEVDDEREPDERAARARSRPGRAPAPSARRTRTARRAAARGTGSAARPRCPAGGSRGSRRAARARRRRRRRSPGRRARAGSCAGSRGRVSDDDQRRARCSAPGAAHLGEAQRREARARGSPSRRCRSARRASRRRTPSRSRPQAGAAASRSRRESGRRRSQESSGYPPTLRRQRGVAQPGQSAAFGRQKPPVRIRPPRLWVSQRCRRRGARARLPLERPADPAGDARQMTGVSWHAGCPVGLGELRLITLTYRGFDGRDHTGRLIANRTRRDRARHRLPPPLRRPLPDPADGAGRPLRRRRLPLDRGRQHLGVQLPARDRLEPLVEPRLRARDRRQPDREPVHLERHDARTRRAARTSTARATGPAWRTRAACWSALPAVGWGWGGSWAGSVQDTQHFSWNGR